MPRHSKAKHQSPRKPEMERKRRQRINNCLSQIKQLIPEAKELEIKKGCRLEKAEILEITVEFLRKMNKKISADKTMQRTERKTGPSVSVGLEEHPPLLNRTNTAPVGPVFPGHFDYDASPPYTNQIPQNRVYPPLLRPTPRFFTPLCVSSNTIYDPAVRGESFTFQQSVDYPLLKETGPRKLDET